MKAKDKTHPKMDDRLKITKSIIKNLEDGTFEVTSLEINGERWIKAPSEASEQRTVLEVGMQRPAQKIFEHISDPSVVTQSEKGEQKDYSNYPTMEDVLNNVALKHGHKDWELARYRLGEKHLHVLILEAMQEYSLLERSRAIYECIQKVKLQCGYCGYEKDGEELIAELEKLKSRQ